MNEMQIFKSEEFGQVRMIEEEGKILFCGADVAGALGYTKTRNAIEQHCKGALKRGALTKGGVQEMLFIPEGDVYRLIARSKLPSAERFESWVFDEVLPSIRKNGGYIAGQKEMSPEELMAKALVFAQNVIDEKDKQIEKMKPKEIFADAVSASKTSILISELAKILRQNGCHTGQKRLFEQLRKDGFLMKTNGSWNMPTQKAMEQGLFEIKESTVANPDGSIRVTRTTKVTGKGQQYFINKYLKLKKAN